MMEPLDYNGEKLTVALLVAPPEIMKSYENDTKKLNEVGYEIMILREMSQKFNFTYSFIDAKHDWGSLRADGTWTGIMGHLVNKTAHLGMGSLFVNVDRLMAVGFLSPHQFVPVTYITSWPLQQEDSFARIVEQDFFIYYMACILIIGVILWLMSFITKINTFDLLFVLISIVLVNSFIPKSIKHSSFKILFLACQIANFFIMILISGMLYESLTMGTKLNTIDSIAELDTAIIDNRVKFYMEEADYGYISTNYHDKLSTSLLGRARRLKLSSLDSKFSKVQDCASYCATIMGRPHIIGYLSNSNLDHVPFYIPPDESTTEWFKSWVAIGVQKGYKYEEHFKIFLLDLFKAGIIDYWKNLLSIKFRMLNNQANANTEISLNDDKSSTNSISLLILLKAVGYGASFAFALFILEIFYQLLIINKWIKSPARFGQTYHGNAATN